MARIGIQKVKTGCTTCKARKVKCDETWPQCKRCTSTGRACDGYRAPPAGSLSWDVLLRAQPRITPVTNDLEVRSLSFFHHAVAPVLSGPFDGSFWTHLVAQMTHAEPAARHAVLAISSLFERFEPAGPDAAVDRFAIFHYNQAIKQLVQGPALDMDVVLIVCILFICIEFLRGDRELAISHATHGVKLLNSAGANSRLASMFSQMNIFPLFFVDTGVDFPHLSNSSLPGGPAGPNFHSITEAQHALDLLCVRTLRLIRSGNPYRFGMTECPPPRPMLDEQRQVCIELDAWGRDFSRFQVSRATSHQEDTTSLALKIRQVLSRIWASQCLNPGEMGYDAHRADFENIIEMARKVTLNDSFIIGPNRPKFTFTMGFNPMLHFIIIKCRFLALRIEGLELLRRLSCARESLWDAALMYDMSRRIIEVEHDIDLDSNEFQPAMYNDTLPPDSKRVRGFFFDENAQTPLWNSLAAPEGRPVNLVMRGPKGDIEVRRDFLKGRKEPEPKSYTFPVQTLLHGVVSPKEEAAEKRDQPRRLE